MARSLQIPAVVGLKTITHEVVTGDTLIIDGSEGKVIVNPDSQTIDLYHKKIKRYKEREKELETQKMKDKNRLEGEIRKRESILLEKDKLIQNIKLATVNKKDNTLLNNRNNEKEDPESELKEMRVMNTKLLTELDILNRQLTEARTTVDELEEKIRLFEDQELIVDELSLANEMLKNRFELEEESNIYRTNSNDKQETNQLKQTNHIPDLYTKKGTNSEYRESDSSFGGFNKTIEEVSEKFENSEAAFGQYCSGN